MRKCKFAIGYIDGSYEADDQVAAFAEAAEWLRANAVRHYPDSAFAEKYARGFE